MAARLFEVGVGADDETFVAFRSNEDVQKHTAAASRVAVRIGRRVEQWSLEDFARFHATGSVPDSQTREADSMRELLSLRAGPRIERTTPAPDSPAPPQHPIKVAQEFKVILMSGTPCVGKTTMLNQYMSKVFVTDYEPTLIDEGYSRALRLGQRVVVTLSLVDTGADSSCAEDVRQLLPTCDGIVLVFALDNAASLDALGTCMDTLLLAYGDAAKIPPIILVGTKVDLPADQNASLHEAAFAFLRRHGLDAFLPITCRKPSQVAQVFDVLAQEMSIRRMSVARRSGGGGGAI